MKDLMHDMELAEQFLSGKMTEQERTDLANRLDHDKEFSLMFSPDHHEERGAGLLRQIYG